MAHTLEDVLSRRTRGVLRARDEAAAAAVDVANLLASELKWTPEQTEQQVSSFRDAVARSREWESVRG
jgi:glycerol-3-phosphate dehydrogenase